MDVALGGEQPVARLQLLEHRLGGSRVGSLSAGQRTEAFHEHAVVADRGDGREAVVLPPLEVDLPAARGGVDDAGALGVGHVLLAVDDTVTRHRRLRRAPAALLDHLRHLGREAERVLLRRQVVERAVVLEAEEFLALHLADDLVVVALAGLRLEVLLDAVEVRHAVQPRALPLLGGGAVVGVLLRAAGHAVELEGALRDVVHLALQLHLEVRQLWVHRRADVAGERPRRRRPDEQVLAGAALDGQLHERALVLDELVPLLHLLLGDANPAPAAPRHHVVPAVDEPLAVALLEEGPDRVVVPLGHREVRLPLVRALGPVGVGAVPVHPVAEADGLVGLHAGELVDAVLARLHEAVDARVGVAGDEVLDVALAAQLQFLLDLDLDPQPLAVEPLLVAEVVAGHGEVAVVGVLVRPPPGVVDAHRVVGGDGAVEEAPPRLPAVEVSPLGENAVLVPELQNGALEGGEVDVLGLDAGERTGGHAAAPRRAGPGILRTAVSGFPVASHGHHGDSGGSPGWMDVGSRGL